MNLYIGTKLLNASAMTRGQYLELRGWDLPADENPEDEGYLVEYQDGGKANTQMFKGYVSWSPKEVFEKAYQLTTSMDFGMALAALKIGKRVARQGWNGKGMWLSLVPNGLFDVACSVVRYDPNKPSDTKLLPWIGMKTADGGFVPWLASQTDMLADDWVLLED